MTHSVCRGYTFIGSLRPCPEPQHAGVFESCTVVDASVVAGCGGGAASAGAGWVAAGALPFLALPGPGQPCTALWQ